MEVVFLDEFRMMIYSPEYTNDPPEFTLVDTFVSEKDRPVNLRRFRLPLNHFRLCLSVASDACIGLGALKNGPLIVDPTQAFILLQLSTGDEQADAVVVLRIQALVEQACLVGADTQIPWGELERDAVVVETLVPYPSFHIQGVYAIQRARYSIFDGDDEPARLRVPTIDFSRRGCSALRDEDGEIIRETWHEGGRDFPIDSETNGTRVDGIFNSFGNGSFYYPVCGFCRRKVHEG